MSFHLFSSTLGSFKSILEFSSYRFCTGLIKFTCVLSSLLLLKGGFLNLFILVLVIMYLKVINFVYDFMSSYLTEFLLLSIHIYSY